jgi:hypothetical protein
MDTAKFVLETATALADRGLAVFEPGPQGLAVAHVFPTKAAAGVFLRSEGRRGGTKALCSVLVPPLFRPLGAPGEVVWS